MREPAPTEVYSRPSGYTGRYFALSVAASLMIATGGDRPTEALMAESAGLGDCAFYFDKSRYRNHEYEVCTAYIANSAQIALQGYYKFGNNRIGFLAAPAKHHFETRYWAGPRRSIEHEVNSWPKTSNFTGNKVKQDVDLVSVSSNLKADQGLVQTRESWRVIDSKGKVLHNEPRHTRNITMCRGQLPGHPLHAWVVVKFSRDPQFNCIAFDKSHDLNP